MEYRLHNKTYIIHLLGRIPLLVLGIIFLFSNFIFIKPNINKLNIENTNILNMVITCFIIFIIICILLFVFIQPHFLYKNARLKLNDEFIEYSTGWIFYDTTFIPLAKVQQVEISSGPIQKKYQASSINIKTAFDSLDTDSLEAEVCTLLKEQILKKTRRISHEN